MFNILKKEGILLDIEDKEKIEKYFNSKNLDIKDIIEKLKIENFIKSKNSLYIFTFNDIVNIFEKDIFETFYNVLLNVYDFRNQVENKLLKNIALYIEKEKCLEDKEKVFAIYLMKF